MGQPKTQLILATLVIINDTCQLPGEFISYSNYVEAPKKCNYVDKTVGPNVSMALGRSFFDESLAGVRP